MPTLEERIADLTIQDRRLIETVKARIREYDAASDAVGLSIHRAVSAGITYGMLSHATGRLRENLFTRRERFLARHGKDLT